MTYLYGDATPSALETNFIQFLCDAMDVSVSLLLSGERMARCSERSSQLRDAAAREMRLIEALETSVARALREVPRRDAASPVSFCAATIAEQTKEIVRAQVDAVRATLATGVAAVESEEALERLGCLRSLEALIRAHDPPEAVTSFHLVHRAGRYRCIRTTQTPYCLEWALEIDVVAPHPFSQTARVDRVSPDLELSAPDLGGWLRKALGSRTVRLEKLLIPEMTLSAKGGSLQLRSTAEAGAPGFDVVYDEEGSRVCLHRAGEEADAIELSEADAANLLALRAKLRALALAIPPAGGRLEDAKLDERSVTALRDPGIVVDRLIAAMAPTVSEIARRSLSPKELVLKRLLGDNRREEIFVSKASLLEKLAPLPEPLRAAFKPLGLQAATSRSPSIPALSSAGRESAANIH
jgi:hypothetical protein